MAIADLKERLRVADRGAQGKRLAAHVPGRLLDLVFPPRCLACPEPTETPMGLCGACWREVHFLAGCVCDLCGSAVPSAQGHEGRVLCEGCSLDPPGWDKGRAAVAYEGVGRQVVLGLKNRDRLDTVPALARWMTGAGAAILEEDMMVAPIPIHWRRRAGRRFNQAAELARAVARRAGLEYRPSALRRIRATETQHGKSREARMANVRGSIEVPKRQVQLVEGRHVLVVDDVLTTGATLSAATEVLRDAGASQVSVLVLARVEKPR